MVTGEACFYKDLFITVKNFVRKGAATCQKEEKTFTEEKMEGGREEYGIVLHR